MGEQSGTQSHSALRIVAACQSTAEFVAAYSRYCEGRSLFIATKSPKLIGQIVKFKIALASGEHLLTGVGPVVETFEDRDNRFNRPGMRVEVEKLDATGRHWMEQLRSRSGAAAASGGAPAVVSSTTGMFSTVSDEVAAMAAPPAPPAVAPSAVAPAVVAPPVVPPAVPAAAAKNPAAVPVAVADNLSAGWDIDGAEPLALPRRPSAPMAAAEKPADKPAGKSTGKSTEKPAVTTTDTTLDATAEPPQQAVAMSGELDTPPPLPPPPNRGGRTKRITFPSLMFSKQRGGIAVPAPSGAVVPRPLALQPGAREGKLRPPTAPAEREAAAPVAPLGTPSDTERTVTVPPEVESTLARSRTPAEGTPPRGALPQRAASVDETHPDIADAPPEDSGEIHTGETMPDATPELRRRAKDSTTTPPPVWAERTVTQTLHALIGGKPDPRVKEETVHWTNPGFAALTRPAAPQVDIVEEVTTDRASSAIPVVVGVEITADVMDQTVISPPPAAATSSRRRLFAAVAITAVAGIGIGYVLGLSQSVSIDKMPVGEVASAADRQIWNPAQCADPARTEMAAAPASAEPPVEAPELATAEPAASTIGSRARPQDRPATPPSSSSSSSSSCYLNAMTSPVGATVLIDNRVSGRTPLRTRVSCGQHGVKFEMANFQAATRTFSVRRGETEKVSAELSRPRAVLRVESSPSGATVLVNGSSVGVTPLTTTIAGYVQSSVTLSKPGYKTITKPINPTTSSARMSVTFKPDSQPAARRSVPTRRR